MTRAIPSERLTLRELQASDCSPDYVAWLADPEINQYLETRHAVQDEASIVAFIEGVRARNDEFLFGMFLNDSGRHIGNIKVGPIHKHHRMGDVSLLVGARDCWGKGYAGEAIAAISRYAFEALGVLKLSASMYAPNLGSKHAFLKVGYRQEGLRRAHYDLKGERCDLVELGLLPSDIGL
jgi:[ribosomal protein S5]-alanine N-acetyltransferase